VFGFIIRVDIIPSGIFVTFPTRRMYRSVDILEGEGIGDRSSVEMELDGKGGQSRTLI
jgi:hypothetical protein